MTSLDNAALYRSLFRIRRFEETILESFSKGIFSGTTHTYIGQEANAVGILSQIDEDDVVFSNHRSHGHFLAYGGSMSALFAELMGKTTGICAGRGGSQHLHWKNFYSNGIQGGIAPIATGIALAEKQKQSRAITIVFLGDGTLGQGILYETLNIASLWQVPILFVLENNHIAQTTPIHLAMAGDIKSRFTAVGIAATELDSSDVVEITSIARDLISAVRSSIKPQAFIIHTCRFSPHSKGDDTRSDAELIWMRNHRDPLLIQAGRIEPNCRIGIEAETNIEVQQAYNWALADRFPVSTASNNYQ